MKEILDSIDRQIGFNRGKNLFNPEAAGSFRFVDKTIAQIERFGNLSESEKEILIDYTTEKVFEEFCRINQYFSFSGNDKNELRSIYSDLFDAIGQESDSPGNISEQHYLSLKQWLTKTNPFASELYPGEGSRLKPVASAEYDPALQLEILQIDLNQLINPILDIGCGKEAKLVKFLRKEGFETYGIDRFQPESKFIFNSDWLEFDYSIQKWGTIISNLGFSNHFHHHHLRTDGNYLDYARKYIEILGSLQPGGSFYYAPDLSFIEPFLDPSKYSIKNKKVGDYPFRSTVIIFQAAP